MYPIDVCAAQVLVQTGGHAVLQRKTPGYPLAAYVGRHCLPGGSWTHARDRSPRDTAWRELSEELRPARVLPDASALRHLGSYELTFPKLASLGEYRVWNFVFGLNLGDVREPTLSLTEGEIVLVPIGQLHRPKYAWGHDLLLQACGASRPPSRQRSPIEGVFLRPLGSGEPSAYHDLALDGLRVNPLRTGDLDDLAPFRRRDAGRRLGRPARQ